MYYVTVKTYIIIVCDDIVPIKFFNQNGAGYKCGEGPKVNIGQS